MGDADKNPSAKNPTVPVAPSRSSGDDHLEAELGAEISRIATTIDTILKKVDEIDPVFRNQNSGDEPPDAAGTD